MLLYKRSIRPPNPNEGVVTEDDGADAALQEFATETHYQQMIIDMFHQHNTASGITLKELLLASHEQDHSIGDFEEWQRALSAVTIRVKGSRFASMWTLRDSFTPIQSGTTEGNPKIVAILRKAKSAELDTLCYLVRYSGSNSANADSHAFVSWEPEKEFHAKHITGPGRRMIDELEGMDLRDRRVEDAMEE
jgi:hypothetical protein